jgi:hypothetical protein
MIKASSVPVSLFLTGTPGTILILSVMAYHNNSFYTVLAVAFFPLKQGLHLTSSMFQPNPAHAGQHADAGAKRPLRRSELAVKPIERRQRCQHGGLAAAGYCLSRVTTGGEAQGREVHQQCHPKPRSQKSTALNRWTCVH